MRYVHVTLVTRIRNKGPHSHMDNRMLARLGSIELSNCRSTTILILEHRGLDNLGGSLFF